MQYLEVATLRETILHQIRTGEAVDVIEQTLREYSDAVWHNGRAYALNEHKFIESDGIVLHKPEPNLASSGAKMPFMIEKDAADSLNRAELIQLTAAALSGLLASDQVEIPSYNLAASAVQCAKDALDLINKK